MEKVSKHLQAFEDKKRKEEKKLGLWTAIHRFQSLNVKAEANGRNSRFKTDEQPKGSPYSNLEDVIATARRGLQFGLIFNQSVICEEGIYKIHTTVRHTNDTEVLESKYPILCINPNNPQSFASSVTYAKRYSLNSLLGFGSEVLEDDDGNDGSPKSEDVNKQQNTF